MPQQRPRFRKPPRVSLYGRAAPPLLAVTASKRISGDRNAGAGRTQGLISFPILEDPTQLVDGSQHAARCSGRRSTFPKRRIFGKVVDRCMGGRSALLAPFILPPPNANAV